jgi:hypothetical protein
LRVDQSFVGKEQLNNNTIREMCPRCHQLYDAPKFDFTEEEWKRMRKLSKFDNFPVSEYVTNKIIFSTPETNHAKPATQQRARTPKGKTEAVS